MKLPFNFSGTTTKSADGTLTVTFALTDASKNTLQQGSRTFPAGTDTFTILKWMKHFAECSARPTLDAATDLASFNFALTEFDILP